MLVMDCRLAILPNKLIKSQATISKFFLRGGNPPQTPPGLRGVVPPSSSPRNQVATQASLGLQPGC